MEELRFKEYGREGKKLLENGCVKDLVFSEGTYQVKVVENNEEFWTFLQLDDQGKVLDAFCSCPESEKRHACAHLAASYQKIAYGPLHIRFKNSFWNHLFKILARRHGFDPSILKKEKEGVYLYFSETKKKLILIEGIDKEGVQTLKKLIENRALETEETSIKFSKLSLEEIALWKEGKSSFSLLFELSFWADLAKALFLLVEENSPYTIDFSPKEELPSLVCISFPSIHIEVYIAEKYLPELIPSLNTVHAPLKVFEEKELLISNISYDSAKKVFIIEKKGKKEEEKSPLKGKVIGEWIFVVGKGFYPINPDPLLESPIIHFDKIPETLSLYGDLFNRYLKNIHVDPIKPNYHLFFDQKENLNITSFLFEIGDLDEKGGWYRYPWIYIPSKGFYRLSRPLFQHGKILKDQVADFVDKHRHFLCDFDGFQTHFSSLESSLIYRVDEKGAIIFDSRLKYPQESGEIIDFGRWVYIKDQGFFHKQETRASLPLVPGLVIKKEEVTKFVKIYQDDLRQVDRFFTDKPPIRRMALKVTLTDEKKIQVIPQIEYASSINPKKIHFYEDVLFVEEEGFYLLPASMRLPERYNKKVTISTTEESFFLNFDLDTLKPFISSLDPRLQKPQDLKLRVVEIKQNLDNWLVSLKYESQDQSEDAIELYRAIKEGKKFYFSNVGLIDLSLMRFNWLFQIDPKQIINNQFQFTTLQWIYLCLFEQLEPPAERTDEALESKKLFEKLISFEVKELLDTALLKCSLRPYQKSGLNWLWFLYCHNLSGLLCDEMGLGKTHQTMALFSCVMQKNPQRTFKYLVVCPTSVIYHWQEKLKQFLPDMRVYLYYGFSRSLEDFQNSADLLLTSYGIVRSQIEKLKTVQFEVAIFDELQIAKNASSLTHRSLQSIQSKIYIGLTGTPIENRLQELKSLFDLILPSYLPSDRIFREEFIVPIEKYHDPEKRKLLASLVKPFILRRKKKEVLKDLPEKIEEISYCDLSDEQKTMYDQVLLSSKDQLLSKLKDQKNPIPYLHVFSLLSQLKQICNHPCLINKDFSNFHNHYSGKWDLFVELLNETRDSGQKLVVFSQYLDMLNMIKTHLESHHIGYSMITGSTKKRHEQIQTFFQDPKCEVFLASLLAAGVGIDLSCASVVIHYDRWWNPAKENQATDRVHRIGQSRGVQVFKLVCKDTIEEYIHQMIERKQKLLEETIGQDDMDQVKLLSREELIAVLEKTKPIK